jgi:hypothetical protein
VEKPITVKRRNIRAPTSRNNDRQLRLNTIAILPNYPFLFPLSHIALYEFYNLQPLTDITALPVFLNTLNETGEHWYFALHQTVFTHMNFAQIP